MSRDNRRGFVRRDGVLQTRGAYFAVKGASMAWVYLIFHDVGMHFHGYEAGPVSIRTSCADQRHKIRLGVRQHHGEIEAGYLDHSR